MIDAAKIQADLKKMGVNPSDTIMVHSSYKAIGKCENGPSTFIEGCLNAITKTGTLIMPCFQSGSQYDCASNFKGFNLNETPSEMGAITEVFRNYSGVSRSLSPTHSLCGIGPNAEKILKDHHKCLVTTGRKSPFETLLKLKAKILLVGVDHKSNTFLHFLENCNGAPTLSSKSFQLELIDQNNETINCKIYPHLPGLPRNYQRLGSELKDPIQTKGKIGAAASYLIKTEELSSYVINKLKGDPLYLITPFDPDQP